MNDTIEIEYISVNVSKDDYKNKKRHFHLIPYLEEIQDKEIKISDNNILYENFEFLFEFTSIHNRENKEQGVFSLRLICENCQEEREYGEIEDEDGDNFIDNRYTVKKIDIFLELKDIVEQILTTISEKEPTKIWDSYELSVTSRYYPLIYELENSLRQLLTKAMFIFKGKNWYEYTIPEDVKIRDKSNIQSDILYKSDFIQINNFLFKNYPHPNKKNLLNELNIGSKKIENLEYDDIKILIDTTNWHSYIKYIFSINKNDFEKTWKDLYKIRNKIAHNTILEESDINLLEQNYKKLSNNIKRAKSIIDRGNLYIEFLICFSKMKEILIEISNKKLNGRGNRPDIKLKEQGFLSQELFKITNKGYLFYKEIFNKNTFPQILEKDIKEIKNVIKELKKIK
jgi:hypothetical protein